MDDVQPLTIDWQRALHIESTIDEELVRRLTPQILSLRQESTAPITIGINSPGGSLAALDILLGLLTGPDQDGNVGRIITVATHRAYSSAANLLAFGTYAVALRHAQVLYHDVRFGGMEDVTPEKARDAAKSLQDANDAFALRLAHRVIRRLIWIYIDLQSGFAEMRAKYPDVYSSFVALSTTYAKPIDGYQGIDLASFATSLWAKLSPQNDALIKNVMQRLQRWIGLTAIARQAPTYRAKGSRIPGLLDGTKHVHKLLSGTPQSFRSIEEGLKLLLCLIVDDTSRSKMGNSDFPLLLERAVREFGILDSMNDQKHIKYASDLMLKHGYIFFESEGADGLESMPEKEKAEIFAKAAPHARLLWHFCVLLCRELFEGEHVLLPDDAQLLGLIDEVSGGGPIQSRREYRIAKAKAIAEIKT